MTNFDQYKKKSGSQLENLIANVQRSSSITRTAPVFSQTKVADKNVSCPRCSEHLILRTAKRGKNAGGQFWGCSAYPKCRYT